MGVMTSRIRINMSRIRIKMSRICVRMSRIGIKMSRMGIRMSRTGVRMSRICIRMRQPIGQALHVRRQDIQLAPELRDFGFKTLDAAGAFFCLRLFKTLDAAVCA